jgi:hypothetical protein
MSVSDEGGKKKTSSKKKKKKLKEGDNDKHNEMKR